MTIPTSDRLVTAVNRMVGRGTGYASVRLTIPLPPVPCPRPRVTKRGVTYYPKRYEEWRTHTELDVAIAALPVLLEGPLVLVAEHVIAQPKTVERAFPQYDVDNYLKGVMDAITKRERTWHDDEQVVLAVTTKRFVTEGEEPHTAVYIRET